MLPACFKKSKTNFWPVYDAPNCIQFTRNKCLRVDELSENVGNFYMKH